MPDHGPVDRSVSCSLTAQVLAPACVELQVAVARPAAEQLRVTLDGDEVVLREIPTDVGGRLHLADVGAGELQVDYRAHVTGRVRPVAVEPLDPVIYLRPSRYAPSDLLAGYARTELGPGTAPAELLRDAAAWVGRRLAYVAGSSAGTDSAVDTLLSGHGVCRDYAHLLVALLRARDVPARLVAVYAPGLAPMDFHAVAEALVDGVWCVADPTLLAPRSGLVRIATGRDAADTAFLSSYGGEVRLQAMSVGAVVDGELPGDDLDTLVQLG